MLIQSHLIENRNLAKHKLPGSEIKDSYVLQIAIFMNERIHFPDIFPVFAEHSNNRYMLKTLWPSFNRNKKERNTLRT